jgi:DNA-binding MarR family transcriptional regulator
MAERGPHWLSDTEQQSWRTLIDVTTGVLATLDAELRAEHSLSLGEYEVLAHLSEEPEHSLRMTDLAGRLRLSPSGITRRIDGLVRAGLVERRQCPSDRRGSNAVLTEAGLRRLRDAAPTHVRGVRAHFVDQLSARDLANLASALSGIDVDASRAAGGCDDEPGADPEARAAR